MTQTVSCPQGPGEHGEHMCTGTYTRARPLQALEAPREQLVLGHVIMSLPWASEGRCVLAEGIRCFLEQLELNLVLGR